ncbi:hypothetical protein SPRG_11987 [Saprolegnia parasitica CBS 223.65]|uniref:Apple domain-containing protein n=1 Tax=Saprolegnia parasitica (strain CBS 223.65) TaxID=695850 RepID=A0A067C156_SAPPC|nr:hypothetical protein SPRG_11987 [Saprolegnia parasitica CBS 223.65]KDO22850.1 hypothetical protein SPRG_11987 [Saprolegnia parasitica CBS 223.65]|eukprot:XP_012206407.1 hypothetical protein SPRG_11987 [Saprolegnia parasitica CBS 223.65]
MRAWVLAATAILAVANQCNTAQKDTDYWGNDLSTSSQSSHGACCSSCVNSARCTHYVWNRYTSTCILKQGVPRPASSVPGAFASILSQPASDNDKCDQVRENTDFWGHDLFQTTQYNAGDCCADCSSQAGCTHYVWNSNTNTCILKYGTPSPSNSVSGAYAAIVKSAPPPNLGTCNSVQKDTDFWGNDFKQTTQYSYGACCSECARHAECTHYVWNSYTTTCILKQGVPNPINTVLGAYAATMPAKSCGTRVRKEWSSLSSSEQSLYIDAITKAKTIGHLDTLVRVHRNEMAFYEPHGSTCAFWFWHRRFLLGYEQMLRSLGPAFACITVPYIDYAGAAAAWKDKTCSSVVSCSPAVRAMYSLPPAFSNVVRGDWTQHGFGPAFTLDMIKLNLLPSDKNTPMIAISNNIETGVHNSLHSELGGDMSGHSSNNDPLFYLHHATVDMFQVIYRKCRLNGVAPTDPRNFASCQVQASGPGHDGNINGDTVPWIQDDTVPSVVDEDPATKAWFQGIPSTYLALTDASQLGPFSYSYDLQGSFADLYNQCDEVGTMSMHSGVVESSDVTSTSIEKAWRQALYDDAINGTIPTSEMSYEIAKVTVMLYDKCMGGVKDFTDDFKQTWHINELKPAFEQLQSILDGSNSIKIRNWRSINS